MFPLGSVLFPGAILPLHVFEPRYRDLVRDCLASEEHEFGVALIEKGSEVGGGDLRSMVATVARLMQVAELDDGRYALITVGTRRIRINEWLNDAPYPQADVDDWPDEPAFGSHVIEHLDSSFARVRRVNALATEMDEGHAAVMATISDDIVLGSYQLCALAPVGPADQQRLLAASGPVERLRLLEQSLDDVEALLQFRLQHESGGEMPTDIDGP
jgi:hypothetical protein